MATAKEFRKKLMVATSDGKNLGKIKNLYFDPNVTKVAALYMGTQGFIMRKKLVIERSKVKMCGIDTCMVSNGEHVVDLKEVKGSGNFVLDSDLEGRHIVSEGDTEIATVDSVIIDDGFNVTGFTLDKVSAPGPIASRKSIARGAISSIGSEDSPMVTNLADAESMELGTQYLKPSAHPALAWVHVELIKSKILIPQASGQLEPAVAFFMAAYYLISII